MVFCVNECNQGAIVLVWAGFCCILLKLTEKNHYFCIKIVIIMRS